MQTKKRSVWRIVGISAIVVVVLSAASTTYVPIEGGNHAQFGWYGDQSGDNPATISREEQQRQIVEATLAALVAGR